MLLQLACGHYPTSAPLGAGHFMANLLYQMKVCRVGAVIFLK